MGTTIGWDLCLTDYRCTEQQKRYHQEKQWEQGGNSQNPEILL